jgi:Fur family ferric uptake transcriptional regulator
MGADQLEPGWQARLRARGFRLTPQRQLVLEAVSALGHGTPEAIAERVQSTAAGVNISTVYRTLDLLEELGLVTHAHLGHGAPTYHVAGSNAHVHLVCHACGSVQEEPVDVVAPLAAMLAEQHGFTLDPGHVSLSGLCAACAGRAAGATEEPVAARTLQGS